MSRRLLTAFLLGAMAIVIVVIALIVFHGDDSAGVDCDTFRVTPALWSRADYDRRVQLVDGLRDCGQLDGRSDTDVVATLGPPDHDGLTELDYYLPFGQGSDDRQVWRIRLDADHRVRGTTLGSG